MNSGEIVITREAIREALMELFEAETGEAVATLNDDQNVAEQLGLDSVDMVSLIMQLERRFKIRLSHEELSSAVTLGLLLDLVQDKANNPQAPAVSGEDTQKMAA
jgi:acyl carrier protein